MQCRRSWNLEKNLRSDSSANSKSVKDACFIWADSVGFRASNALPQFDDTPNPVGAAALAGFDAFELMDYALASGFTSGSLPSLINS
jgi:hypothetical protein